jgi:uncharacterized alkaline shock family protein YloU
MSESTTAAKKAPARTGGRELVTDQGRTAIADGVVSKIAGIAARDIRGVASLGSGMSRTFGALRQRMPGSGREDVAQGVAVEVGERQAAIDIDLVVQYGVGIPDLASSVRGNVIDAVERMTGLEVTEVNIAIDDLVLPEDREQPHESRVE